MEKSGSPSRSKGHSTSQSARSASRSASATRKQRPLENAILLFIVSHGLEGGSFLNHLSIYLDQFKVAQDPRQIIANDVFLTLGLDQQSSAYVNLFENDKTHGIGNRRSLLEQPIVEVLKDLLHRDGSTPRQHSDLENIVTLLNEHQIFTLSDIGRFSADDIENILFILDADVEDVEGMENVHLHHRISPPDLAKQLIDKLFELRAQLDFKTHLYNNFENISINQLVSMFCLSKKDISYKSYNDARKLVKQQLDNHFKEQFGQAKRCRSLLRQIEKSIHRKHSTSKRGSTYVKANDYKEMRNRLIQSNCQKLALSERPLYELYKRSNKYLDMEITEKSMDRILQLYPNFDHTKHYPRMYGVYVVKAQHNGRTFCKTDLVSKTFLDALKETRVIAKKRMRELNVTNHELEMAATVFAEEYDVHYLTDYAQFFQRSSQGFLSYTSETSAVVFPKFKAIISDEFSKGLLPVLLLDLYKEYMETINQHALDYNNPFIGQLVDQIDDPEVRDRLIKMFNRKDILLSEIVAGCKAMGFDKVYAFDPSCRDKSKMFNQVVHTIGIPMLKHHLQQLGLEKLDDFNDMTEHVFREKMRALEAVYAQKKDPTLVEKVRNIVGPILEQMLPDRSARSSLKAIAPRVEALEESPVSYQPEFKQKAVYHPKDNVDFFVFVGEKQLYRRGKIVSGNKAKGYKIKCLDTTCGGLGQSVFEGVPFENISQYDSIHDYAA